MGATAARGEPAGVRREAGARRRVRRIWRRRSAPRCRLPQVPRTAAAPAADYAPQPGVAGEGDALVGASNVLAQLLDAAAAAIAASRSHVPAVVQGVLARLFPAASSISAALPSPGGCWRGCCGGGRAPIGEGWQSRRYAFVSSSGCFQLPSGPAALPVRMPPPHSCCAPAFRPAADGQALAVTTLLHPAAAAPGTPAAAAVHHSEPLGAAGVCSFHLAAPPSSESLRLMRAFLQQLGRRLAAQQAQLGAREHKVGGSCRSHAPERGMPPVAPLLHPPATSPPQPPSPHTPAATGPRHQPACSGRRGRLPAGRLELHASRLLLGVSLAPISNTKASCTGARRCRAGQPSPKQRQARPPLEPCCHGGPLPWRNAPPQPTKVVDPSDAAGTPLLPAEAA